MADEATKTRYTILGGTGDSWRVMGEVEAAGQTDALRQYTSGANSAVGGVYVAIPTRSWHPTRVEEKVTKTMLLIPATPTPDVVPE